MLIILANILIKLAFIYFFSKKILTLSKIFEDESYLGQY